MQSNILVILVMYAGEIFCFLILNAIKHILLLDVSVVTFAHSPVLVVVVLVIYAVLIFNYTFQLIKHNFKIHE